MVSHGVYDPAEAAGVAAMEAYAEGTCDVWGLTWNSEKGLYEPPYVLEESGVPCDVASMTRLVDPDLNTLVQQMGIQVSAYRQVTLPARFAATVRPNWQVRRGDYKYQVVQAYDPDETGIMELVLHCRKV